MFVGIVGDQVVSGFQNAVGRAIVLFQLDDSQVWKVFAQFKKVFRPGTTPCVDRLIIIAYHCQGLSGTDQLSYQAVLRPVGVLIFVH